MNELHMKITSRIIIAKSTWSSKQYKQCETVIKEAIDLLYQFIHDYVQTENGQIEEHMKKIPPNTKRMLQAAYEFNWMSSFANEFYEQHHLPKLMLK